ncbi:MAG: hypothetical protein AAB521_02035 [Patescibacteria group bacterium]
MVILRRTNQWIDQEIIAEELGARITPKVKDSFTVKLRTIKNEKITGLWLREFKEQKIKAFFKKHKLNLKSEVFYINQIKDVKSFIEENLKKNNDIMANYWLKPFYKDRDNGHFCLISSINGPKVTFCDPGIGSKASWEADIKTLEKSMGKQFDGHLRGFAVFTSS